MSSRWTWRLLALPGVAWLSIFFIVSFYAVICVAFGNQDTFSQPVPFWNPLDWNVGYVLDVLRNFWHGGQYLTVFLRTLEFVAIAMALSLVLGYPVAYFAARHGGRWKGLVLLAAGPAVLDQLPDADARLDQPALARSGWARDSCTTSGSSGCSSGSGSSPSRGGWLDGQPSTVIIALVYGYIPFLILPLLRGARPDRPAPDRGGARSRREPAQRFLRVTLPLSVPGDPGRRRARSRCRCSATTTRPTSSRRRRRRT